MSPSASDADFPSDLRALERDYELIREIGQGGMAAVFLARRRATGRVVAIKAIRARYLDDPDALQRFTREAATVAGLDHPNIVRTESIEQIGDRAVAIVMEHVAGGTVRDWLREHGSLGAEHAESILRDVANALGYAHRRGIVHRDVKPENVFLDAERGRAVLSDFGIARSIDGDEGITLLGAALGTPQYMSPEQIDGQMVDGRSDIYSLGVLGWELLTGRRPWAGESLYGVIYKQKHEDLPRITSLRPRVPANLLFAIERALVKDKKLRWQTTEEFLDQLTYNPPPVLAQTYPPGALRGDDQPTVRFRRLALVRDDEAETATEKRIEDTAAIVTARPAPASIVRLDSPRLPVAQFAAPVEELPDSDDRLAPTAPVAEFAPLPPFEPNVEPTFGFPSRRTQMLRALGLIVPLGIAAAALFIVLGDGAEDRARRPRTEVTSSAGSVAPDSVVTPPGALTANPGVAVDAKLPNVVEDVDVGQIVPEPVQPAAPAPRRASRPTASVTAPPTTPGASSVDGGSTPRQPATSAPAARSEPMPTKTEPVLEDPFRIPPPNKPVTLGAAAGGMPSPRCQIAAAADQRACLDAYIAAGDVPLTQAFESLVGELRRLSATPAGAPDPLTVQRVRVEQRAWLSVRNDECPRTPRAGGGAFWAQAQSECFSEMAASRTAELRDAVRRLKKK